MASAIGTMEIKRTRPATGGLPGQFLVKSRGEEVGLVEQFRGKDEPWHAYYPIGFHARKVGTFYGPGGRQRAAVCVLHAAGLMGD